MKTSLLNKVTNLAKRCLPYGAKRCIKGAIVVCGNRPKKLAKPHGELALRGLTDEQRIALVYDTPKKHFICFDGDYKHFLAQGYRVYCVTLGECDDDYQVIQAADDQCYEVRLSKDALALKHFCQDLKVHGPIISVQDDAQYHMAVQVPGHVIVSNVLKNADALPAEVDKLFPKVSVIVLTFNNLSYTQTCIDSLMQQTHYPNLEIIIVDNQSTDGTIEYLENYQQLHSEVKVLFNQENLGFAKGNNVGIGYATGEYVVILNNDTCVTDGWVQGMLRHFRQQPNLGLLGPVTNNIDNEAKVNVTYPSLRQMPEAAYQYTSKHPHELYPTKHISFFCTMIPMKVLTKVGLLSEDYSVGLFEDDDYCQQVMQADLEIGIAEDVFVHHHFSATFATFKFAMQEDLLARNKAVFEKKWGPWQPHRYR